MTPETQQRLSQLADLRAKPSEVADVLGHPLTAEERATYNRLLLASKIRRRIARYERPATGAERIAKMRQRERQIVRRAPEDAARRKRLEAHAPSWLRHYMPGAFPLSWSDGHRAMIDGAIKAAKTGGGIAVAAPRGEGKTTVLRGICLFLVATGQVRFPVMAGWTHKAAAESYRIWLRMLHGSPEFAADYPELCQPFEESTHSARVKGFVWDDGTPCGAEVRSTDRTIVFPGSVGAIAAGSVQGDVKGLNVTLPNGEVLRPDLLLIDDAQDPKRADNPSFVADVMETIDKQWLCLAGPTTRITAMVACTVAAAGDVSEQFLDREGYKAVRVGRVTTWPDGWDSKESEARALWNEWHAVRLNGLQDGDGGIAGRQFYRAHKAAMTTGMTVSWSERYDRKRKDPDALYSAMVDLYRIGEDAFATEYQNRPLKKGTTVYSLTPAVIQSRADSERQAGVVPPWSQAIVAAVDLNPSYAFSWTAACSDREQMVGVLDYGLFKESPLPLPAGITERERDGALFEALVKVGKMLAAKPYRVDAMVIDAGGAQFDAAVRFAAQATRLCGIPCIAATGRGAKQYRPYGKSVLGRPREQCHMAVDTQGRKWVAWNADYWGEVAQKGWTGSLGAPGSCSLPKGSHRELAEQICRVQLKGKAEIAGQMVWLWDTQPGPHDFHDVMAMVYMGLAWNGIGTGANVQEKTRKVANVVIRR